MSATSNNILSMKVLLVITLWPVTATGHNMTVK